MQSKSKIEISKEKLIKVKAVLAKTLYPKPPAVLGSANNEFGLTLWEVRLIIQGTPITDKNSFIKIKGLFTDEIKKYQEYTIVAQEENHPKYGLAYNLLYLVPDLNLDGLRNQKAFISTLVNNPETVTEMFEKIENPMKALKEGDIDALTQIKGIGEGRARNLIEKYKKTEDKSEIIMELAPYGVSQKMIEKLLYTYKSNKKVIDIVKTNPYQLSYDVDGIGFLKADELAANAGLSPKSIERIKAFIAYYLNKQADDTGDSYIKAVELKEGIYSFFDGAENIVEFFEKDGVKTNNIAQAILELQKENIITVEDHDNPELRRIYLTRIYNLEYNIAKEINRLLSAPNNFKYDDWLQSVQVMEEYQGFNFDETQLKGIKLGLDKQVCLISGLAGSGKSSLVAGILASLKDYSFAQCALSGKAAARLQEVTGEEGCTIHRLLGYNPAKGFEFHEYNPLPYDIVILDEISLVGGDIFLDLIRAIPTGSKLIMLGDLGQLESIGKLNLAYDFYNSPYVPSVELKTIHRQAAESGIITTAHDVRNQMSICDKYYEGVQVLGDKKDMVLDVTFDKEEISANVERWFNQEYNGPIVNKDINKIQLIAPVKTRGMSCVYELNNMVQDIVNPITSEDLVFKCGPLKNEYTVHSGDKVMCIKNDYHVLNTNGERAAIFNGWTGIVKTLDMETKSMTIFFPIANDEIILPFETARDIIILGYASTVHKLQGSDAPVVIGVIDTYTPRMMLTCQLLYTLITRAKKKCILIAENSALNICVGSNFVSDKRTFMQEILENMAKTA